MTLFKVHIKNGLEKKRVFKFIRASVFGRKVFHGISKFLIFQIYPD